MLHRFAATVSLVSAVLTLSCPAYADTSAQRKSDVERKSGTVMPFSMDATMHMFAPSARGGVQTIVAHDGDPKQVALVRSHLRKEAEAFSRGDFADPSHIHGKTMPGVKAMAAGAPHIRVHYADVANGGSIVFESSDPQLIAAVHAWFKSQVSDHGSHAAMKM